MSLYNEVVSAMHGEVVSGQAAKVRERIEVLLKNVNTVTFDVAELLSQVKREKYYSVWGYNTFKEYLTDLDIKLRKAQYLVRIVDVMEELSVLRAEYEKIGVAKLREITSLNPNDSYTDIKGNESVGSTIILDLLTNAASLSLEEIKERVKLAKGLVGENEIVWLNIAVTKTVRDEIILPALELAKAHIGSVSKDDEGISQDASDGRALEMIAVEYLNDPVNTNIKLTYINAEEFTSSQHKAASSTAGSTESASEVDGINSFTE